jgi:cell division transport system ATP-binding protein
VVEAFHLSKLYGRGVYALRDLSLTVDKGEFVFLTGPSGAGKSTLLGCSWERVRARADRRQQPDLARMSASRCRPSASVGFVFQDFKLIPRMTVLENVALVPRVLGAPVATQRRKTFQVLKWVGLQHRINAYPLELSGGEQQRIAIARALVNDPALILADEPTGNLDRSSWDLEPVPRINARGTTRSSPLTIAGSSPGRAEAVTLDQGGRELTGRPRWMRRLATSSGRRRPACGGDAGRPCCRWRPSPRPCSCWR